MELKVTVWLCREHVQQLTEHSAKHGELDFDFTVGSGVCYSAEHGNEEVPAVCAARLLVEPVGWSRRQLAAKLEAVVVASTPIADAPEPVTVEEPPKKEVKARPNGGTKSTRAKRAELLTSEDSAQKYVVCPHCSQIHWIGAENTNPEELVCACQKKILVKAK